MESNVQTLATLHASPVSLERTGARLLERFLSARNPRTLAAYRQDLEDFRAFVGAATPEDAGRLLLERGHGEANGLALDYRSHLLARGLSPATVNRRLAALRSLVKLARTLGFVSWELEVEGVKSESYRDTRGPGRAGVRDLLAHLEASKNAKGTRDRAVVRLLFDLGLRRGEACSLRLEDVDLVAGTVAVLGKGRTERAALSLPAPTRAALEAWLAVRGSEPGWLFVNFDRAGKGSGLTGRSLHRIVRELGRAVGLTVRPHGLRHAAITEALELTNGNVRVVQRFSRHRDLRVLNRYDDNREDLGGEVARLVAATA